MTIIMIEATAEELSANRTVMDNVTDVLNKFCDKMFGFDYEPGLLSEDTEKESE